MNIIDKLKEVRQVARRMHESYLRAHNLYDYIFNETSGDDFAKFNIRERIDYIIANKPNYRCHCGNLLKIGQKNCSAKCTGQNPENIKIVSERQKANSVSRWEKCKQTNLEKYGVIHNTHRPECQEARAEKRKVWSYNIKRETFKKYGLDYDKMRNKEYLQSLVDSCSSLKELSIVHFGNMNIAHISRFIREIGCTCYQKSTSWVEKQIANYIESLGFDIEVGSRKFITPYEVDILIHDKKFGVELNGIYYHSIKVIDDKNYHKMKTNMVEKLGYSLLHIYENEWECKQEIVKSIICAKLGIFSKRFYARNCSIKNIPSSKAKEFFEENHLQGHASAKIYVGLEHNGTLISCVSFGKPRFSKEHDWELIRFASKKNIQCIGGFGKLLSFFKKNNVGSIMTYADRRYSTGITYAKFGKYIRTTAPGYSWNSCIDNSHMFSRYQTQKSKLRKLFPDYFSEIKTEDEIMESAGFFKLYDAGNLVYEL